MSATLKLTHKTIGVEVRRGTYNAMVDGERAGSVELNETIDIPVDEAPRTFRTAAPLRLGPSEREGIGETQAQLHT